MVEHRPTALQALWKAFRFAVIMCGGAGAAALLLVYFGVSYLTPNEADRAWFIALFSVGSSAALLTVLLTIMGWMQNLSEPTRAEIEERKRAQAQEVEERERELARTLLAKYPDLG